ncbi:hypothetical protein OUZ56_000756 [Daphnia magna]|uniref:Uncharacterized protein n=1 Tax=Daphnia magna TaxID=35525 RepID=A0ABR0A0N2_9CRUS|nr:hypothetical protein OUZ56_000756 [Daphnia magna]
MEPSGGAVSFNTYLVRPRTGTDANELQDAPVGPGPASRLFTNTPPAAGGLSWYSSEDEAEKEKNEEE